MLELKIANFVGRLHRRVVDAGLRSLEKREQKSLEHYDADHETAQYLLDQADLYKARAKQIREEANMNLSERTRTLNAATNILENMKDRYDA